MTKFLAACRYLMLIPILGSLLLTLGVVAVGVVRPTVAMYQLMKSGEFSARSTKLITLDVIQTIDMFLVATVTYITAIGLYKLFISSSEVELPTRIKIRSLMDLESKIIGVIVLALGISFLGQAISDSEDMLHSGIAIGIIILALGGFLRLMNMESDSQEQS